MSDIIKIALLMIGLSMAYPCTAADISENSLRAADAEQMRIIVDGDAKLRSAFMHQNCVINGPSNRVLRKAVLMEMLANGRMASERFERGEWQMVLPCSPGKRHWDSLEVRPDPSLRPTRYGLRTRLS